MSFVEPSIFGARSIIGDAAAPYALISTSKRSIGTIFPDIVVEERHSDRLEVTQHPVQTGAVVTDHSFAPPAMLTMRCGFSDCTAQYDGYVIEVYDAFIALQATRQPFSVMTGKRLYDSMLITGMDVQTDEYNETALSIIINLQQVRFVDAGSSLAQASFENSAFPQQTASPVNVGTVALQPVTNAPTFVQYMNLFQPKA